MSDGPERIFLQPDDFPEQDDMPHEGRTWAVDDLSGRDTEYVRADLVAGLRADNERLQAVVDKLLDFSRDIKVAFQVARGMLNTTRYPLTATQFQLFEKAGAAVYMLLQAALAAQENENEG